MMKVLSCVSVLLVSGCATVSMVSQEAVIETETNSEQSALRETAEAFKTSAETRGWVTESRGLMDFANILFGGTSEQTDRPTANYAEQIDAASADPASVYTTIETDARSAALELEALDALATDLLASEAVDRSDVISFESALVVAQKSYRSFSEAAGIAGARSSDGLAGAELALAQFATTIDMARNSADQLASAYADGKAAETASS
ncbi:MAG: hypothetical protein WA989_00335 [Henriciella sp.]|uniref:hypothetical protein n=1 Tax=Henriciella sp. TaxID=1968823 RepID=UPI003C74DD06